MKIKYDYFCNINKLISDHDCDILDHHVSDHDRDYRVNVHDHRVNVHDHHVNVHDVDLDHIYLKK